MAGRSCSRASTRRPRRRNHSPSSRWRTSEVERDATAAQAVDRLAVEALGERAIAHQRPRSCLDTDAHSVPAACVRSRSRSSASASPRACRCGRPPPPTPATPAETCSSSWRSPAPRGRVHRVQAQAVLENGAGVLAEREHHPRRARSRPARPRRSAPIRRPRRPRHAASMSFGTLIRRLSVASMIESVSSVDTRATSGFPSHTQLGEVSRGDLQRAERPGVAGDLKVSRGEHVPGLVVEQVHCDTRREPGPTRVLLVVSVLAQRRARRALEIGPLCRRRRCIGTPRPSRSGSTVRGGPGPAGGRAAVAASSMPLPADRRRTPRRASRCVSRTRRGSNDSAAARRRGAARRLAATADVRRDRPRSRSTIATSGSSIGADTALSRSLSAASGCRRGVCPAPPLTLVARVGRDRA